MYSIIINNNLEDKSSKNRDMKVNFGRIYIFLLIFSVSLIYFYSVYQSNYLTVLIPYSILWPISIILIGISILRVKNSSAFSLAFFITTLSVSITITSIFVYSSNIQDNVGTEIIQTKDLKEIALKVNLISSEAKINSEQGNTFQGDFVSNYDTLISNKYIDENKIMNINLEQNLFPPGLGSYKKNANINLPMNLPIDLELKSNLSSIDINLSSLKLKSLYIGANNSKLNMVIQDVNIEKDVVLDINSRLSILDIVIEKDIPIIIYDTSNLSQTNFVGIGKVPGVTDAYQTLDQNNDSNKYLSNIVVSNEDSSDINKLIINLKSNLSQVNIIQK